MEPSLRQWFRPVLFKVFFVNQFMTGFYFWVRWMKTLPDFTHTHTHTHTPHKNNHKTWVWHTHTHTHTHTQNHLKVFESEQKLTGSYEECMLLGGGEMERHTSKLLYLWLLSWDYVLYTLCVQHGDHVENPASFLVCRNIKVNVWKYEHWGEWENPQKGESQRMDPQIHSVPTSDCPLKHTHVM